VATLLRADVGVGPNGQLEAGSQLSAIVDLGSRSNLWIFQRDFHLKFPGWKKWRERKKELWV